MKNLLLVRPTPECYSNETTWHGAMHKDPVVALNVATQRNLCQESGCADVIASLSHPTPVEKLCLSPNSVSQHTKLIVLILPQTFHFRNIVRPSS